ncbi:MAG TPA: pilus assembly protein TadG-related protein [Micromonosporaceae bacterium]|nr:pilus assembly protein TadG-related protein [Micromonosporaceae bacterium]
MRSRRDRGAIAAIVTIFLATNALFAVAMLTVDVGLLFVERERLQSGADAAVVAVAKVCAGNNPACSQDPVQELVSGIAASYAGANAEDGTSNATVCGRMPAGGLASLTPCVGGPTNLAECIGNPPDDPIPYVEVRTSTRLPDSSTALPTVFAAAVTGIDGPTIAACARASWVPVTGVADAPALVMPRCNFLNATDNGTTFQPPPTGPHQHHVLATSYEFALPFEDPGDSGCQVLGTPRQMPDGFGWLTTGFAGCHGAIRVGLWYDGLRPLGTPDGCAQILQDAYDTSTPISVGIYDDANAPANPDQYRIMGIAEFVVTGWHEGYNWTGGPVGDHDGDICVCPLFTTVPISYQQRLSIYGYFTTQIIGSGTGVLGAQNFGAVAVKTIG